MTIIAPGFTGSPLQRVDHLREDAEAVARLRSDPAARLLAMDGLDPVPTEDGGLTWLPMPEEPGATVLLGLIDGSPRFAALGDGAGGGVVGPSRSPVLFRLLATLPSSEAATYAVARSLVDWHARHGYCPRCGAATEPVRAGWARRCTADNSEHFPRTDPVVIMLAEHDGRVLVGRQAMFPAGRYSALAGFVEIAESIEEAVARELFEEAGVRARSVRYLASQPWPFPSSLMIACVAQVADDTITLDTKELEDAMWVTRDEVAAALREEPGARFLPPPAYAIANTLFQRWLADD
jgi:NAD+ diphosphatase